MNGINQNRIKLSQLRTLVAVAEHGNFSEAALHLEISQSAVSHAIATLEEELGVPLLARGRHGANLTPAGEGVISYARQVLQLLDGMVEEANSHRGLKGGQVRVGAFRSVATHVLPELVAQFRSRFPDIAITLIEYFDALEVERDLRAGKIDVGFMDLPTSEDFETCEILRDEYVALLPPTAKVSCPQLTWKQLATYPLIFETPGNACYVRLRNYLQNCGISLPIAYEIREDSTRVRMVAQGLGAAILFRLAALPIPSEVKVCHLPVPLERIVGAAVLADALHPPAVYAFMNMLKETRLAAAS
ncbi:MAG: LysR family transcriptional regulator [Microcoleus sp. SIO2G3]|nr:LysR family transcriptional regulator [Microcoleus sp. SIO2G3]